MYIGSLCSAGDAGSQTHSPGGHWNCPEAAKNLRAHETVGVAKKDGIEAPQFELISLALSLFGSLVY